MGGVWMRVRADLRSGWVSVVALAVLIGVAGGTVLTAAGGARRTASSYDRLVEHSKTSDTFLEILSRDPDPAWIDEIEQLPEVETLGRVTFVAALPDVDVLVPMFAAVDGAVGDTIERGRLMAGRRADPDAPHEVTVSEATAELLDLEPGSRFVVRTFGLGQGQGFEGDEAAPEGPDIELTVAGITRSPSELGAPENDTIRYVSLLTPAFYETYRDEVQMVPGQAVVRLRGGPDAFPEFRSGVQRVLPPGVDVALEAPQQQYPESVDDSLSVLALGLWLFAAAAALASAVAIAVTVARQSLTRAADDASLAAMGMTRSNRVAAVIAPVVVSGLVGAGLAVAIAFLASPLMPIGLGREAEPNPGFAFDAAVSVLGVTGIFAVVVGLGAATAWRECSRAAAASRVGPARPSIVSRWSALSAYPSTATGVRMALEPGAGRTSVPVRPALAGSIAGVVGVVAVLVLGTNLDRFVDSPERYGWGWDVGFSGVPPDAAAAEPDVDAVATGWFAVPAVADGQPVSSIGIEPIVGPMFITVAKGRAPQDGNEVVLGRETLDRLGLGIGDRVEIENVRRTERTSLLVVGQGVFPSPSATTAAGGTVAAAVPAGVQATLANGAAFHADVLRELGQLVPGGRGGEELARTEDGFEQTLVRFAPGVDEEAAITRLESTCEGCAEPVAAFTPSAGPDVERLESVEALPTVLALFLSLLAVLAVGYALVAAVTKRRHDYAVLETLGFTRFQLTATVAWQATTLVVVGLVVGIPAGIIAGRAMWVLIADGLGVGTDTTVPVIALVAVAVGALVVANLVAVLPGRAATWINPAAALRSE